MSGGTFAVGGCLHGACHARMLAIGADHDRRLFPLRRSVTGGPFDAGDAPVFGEQFLDSVPFTQLDTSRHRGVD